MAEFLIFAKEGKADPAEGFQKYDIVAVAEDGHAWGREECLEHFVVVSIPGWSVEQAKIYTVGIEEEMPGSDPEMPETIIKAVRKYFVNFDAALRADVLEEIRNSDWYVPIIVPSDIQEKTI